MIDVPTEGISVNIWIVFAFDENDLRWEPDQMFASRKQARENVSEARAYYGHCVSKYRIEKYVPAAIKEKDCG